MKWLTTEAARAALAVALLLLALVAAPDTVRRACVVLAVPAPVVVEP